MGRGRGAYKKDKRDSAPQNADGYIAVEDLRTLENVKFTKFYQGTVIPAEQWDECLATFRRPLPSCFRVNTALKNAAELRDFVEEQLSKAELEQINFVPNRMGFQTVASRSEIKRDATKKHTKQLLVALSAEGFVSRQEAVSMIPPLLLDIQPGNRVIDMCAAPGSKTTQILERLAAQGPGGLVIANDVNQGRLDVLTHQTARLPDAKSRLVITNHDATCFPLVTDSAHKFDRVLCDVMCSGDGTLRKSVDLWARWNPLMGPHLHEQQSRVLMRGMGLCKEGGIVVYSTCSMNPAEDESVIARCLAEANGAFELIDPTELLPNLKYYPGMKQWSLLSPDGELSLTGTGDSDSLTLDKRPPKPDAPNVDDADGAEAPETVSSKPKRGGAKPKFTYTKSMFAPDAAAADAMHLERCVRVAPHLQDTGGFFIAGLRCVSEIPGSVGHRAKYSSMFTPVTEDILAELRKGVTLPDTFPFHRLFCNREAGRSPKVYYVEQDCADMVQNINAKILQVGVKVFESQVKQSWAHVRIVGDGAATIAPLLGDLVLRTSASVFIAAVEVRNATAEKSVRVTEEELRSGVVTYCPDIVPTSGVVQVECGSAIGNLFLPFDTHRGGVTVHYAPTQLALMSVSLGRQLHVAVEADGEAEDAATPLAQEQRAQPPAE